MIRNSSLALCLVGILLLSFAAYEYWAGINRTDIRKAKVTQVVIDGPGAPAGIYLELESRHLYYLNGPILKLNSIINLSCFQTQLRKILVCDLIYDNALLKATAGSKSTARTTRTSAA